MIGSPLRKLCIYAVAVSAAIILTGCAGMENVMFPPSAIKKPAEIKLPATFEKIGYRPEKRTLLGFAWESIGKLAVTENDLNYTTEGKTITIPISKIQSITWRKLPPDIANDWAVVEYRSASDTTEIAAFLNSDAYWAIKSAFEAKNSSAVSSYQEFLMGGFDPKDWNVGHQAGDQNQRIIEFVRPGEKIDNWTELLTIQTLRKPPVPEPIDTFVRGIHSQISKSCPNIVSNVIARQLPTDTVEASILYEWKTKNCPPEADQHEIGRIMYGKFNIFRLAYVAKTQALAPEKRDKLIKELSAAMIVVKK